MHRATVPDGKAWRQGLAVWLLLLSIFTHAVVPTGSPLQRTSGSAFSASTAEVAIAPKRKTVRTEQAELSDADAASSEGAGSGDRSPLPVEDESFPRSGIAREATLVFGTAWVGVPKGGAAPFSARAPPTI